MRKKPPLPQRATKRGVYGKPGDIRSSAPRRPATAGRQGNPPGPRLGHPLGGARRGARGRLRRARPRCAPRGVLIWSASAPCVRLQPRLPSGLLFTAVDRTVGAPRRLPSDRPVLEHGRYDLKLPLSPPLSHRPQDSACTACKNPQQLVQYELIFEYTSGIVSSLEPIR
jgi:hypothetical protein